ncbi:MAG TPA: ABC transporter ATP-binding protein [Candidatus Nitrosotalea sp.]|nr:ABC transporter ATP-binding protein [Candidatus Nitrosotalea sp.]
MARLAVKDLRVEYRLKNNSARAVDGVSFELQDGESVGIVGESGCGKTTLGLAMMRAVQGGRIESGEILLDGKPLQEMSEREFTRAVRWKQISMVFQGAMNSLDPVFSIKQQFDEVLQEHGYEGDGGKLISDTLAAVGLSPSVLDKFPHELSGGMKQRVVIAMALLLGPKIVIADEPTTALDVLVQAQILELLKKLKKEGLTVVLISHDLGIVSEISDRIAIMYAGKVVEFGSLREVYSDPKHPYTQALLKATPKIRGDLELATLKGNPPSLYAVPEGCRFYDRCPKAMEKCKKDPPTVKTPTGYVCCWLFE